MMLAMKSPPGGKQLSKTKQLIVDLVKAAPKGLLVYEIEHTLDLPHQSASARVGELRDDGYLIETDKRRETSGGKTAAVYIYNPNPRPPKKTAASTVGLDEARKIYLKALCKAFPTQDYTVMPSREYAPIQQALVEELAKLIQAKELGVRLNPPSPLSAFLRIGAKTVNL